MRRLPPLTELRAFEAAARQLSFKDAAAELGVTPTAVSHQIKLLEQFCGQQLFRRQPRPLALTPAGQQLFPVVRDGFEIFAEALAKVSRGTAGGKLRITATNAFAARWLVPRLPLWRAMHPRVKLDIVGTDAVLDLDSGEADIAIRYARRPPAGLPSVELMRDSFCVVASPKLVGSAATPLRPCDLTRFPLIESEWPAADAAAPRWQQWQKVVGRRYKSMPDVSSLVSISFREELHAIEAAVAGQGIAICSDVLVGPELASGALVAVSRVRLPGYGFYIVHRPLHSRLDSIEAFIKWARSTVSTR
ncbi:MAG: LysR substrate-binding domain-containing protein [Bradyrhizobium sp.]|uniref:LysR substrate-binding domain-containing protein n=1 Tax=Bradyrhizobium sp. TaxID=376 RepID=UPI002A2A9918|nr:LysR family transcriptional regulator [Bradyrhizobium sp.]